LYLLISASNNIAFASVAMDSSSSWRRMIAVIGSFLLLAAPFVLGAQFIKEPLAPNLDGNLTRIGIYATLAGVALRFTALVGSRRSHRPVDEGAT